MLIMPPWGTQGGRVITTKQRERTMPKKNSVELMTPAQLVKALERVPRALQAERQREIVRHCAALMTKYVQREQDQAERDAKYEKLQAIGKGAAESIADMVAALECDYDRLETLRDEREDLFSEANPWVKLSEMREDYTCSCGLSVHPSKYNAEHVHTDDCPWHALTEWDEANGDELKELEEAAGECKSREDAERRIHEDPLSLELTFGSCSPGERPEAEGFIILLGTGGPAVRIVGELDQHNAPKRAWIEAQDWFLPWTEYHGDGCSVDSLLAYCCSFSFESGE